MGNAIRDLVFKLTYMRKQLNIALKKPLYEYHLKFIRVTNYLHWLCEFRAIGEDDIALIDDFQFVSTDCLFYRIVIK